MSNSCYVGRGTLLVEEISTSRGFYPLLGQSELTLNFEEANESVEDARHGVIERIDWYPRSKRMSLVAEVGKIEEKSLNLLLKGNSVDAANMPFETLNLVIPSTIETGNCAYFGRPNALVSLTSFLQANLVPVPADKFEFLPVFGLIRIKDKTGLVFPLTAQCDFYTTVVQAISTRNSISVRALFTGFNKASGKEVFAEFYSLKLDITETLGLIQRGFTAMTLNLAATPDFTQPESASPFGYYGRILQND